MNQNLNPHYFVAVSICDQAKAELKHICERLKKDFYFSKWVHEQDFHITLAFLGRADEGKLEMTNQIIQEKINGHSGFHLNIDSLGFFGRPDSPRIFWAGVEREEKLFQLREKVFLACTEAGFELETRPFSPHITLARKWVGEQKFEKTMLNRLNDFQQNPVRFMAQEVVLYKTNINETPKYETITSFSLIE